MKTTKGRQRGGSAKGAESRRSSGAKRQKAAAFAAAARSAEKPAPGAPLDQRVDAFIAANHLELATNKRPVVRQVVAGGLIAHDVMTNIYLDLEAGTAEERAAATLVSLHKAWLAALAALHLPNVDPDDLGNEGGSTINLDEVRKRHQAPAPPTLSPSPAPTPAAPLSLQDRVLKSLGDA